MTNEKVKSQKLPLLEYYHSLLRHKQAELRRDVMNAVLCDVATFYRWMNRESKPSRAKAQRVAEIAGKPIGELFPEYDDDNKKS